MRTIQRWARALAALVVALYAKATGRRVTRALPALACRHDDPRTFTVVEGAPVVVPGFRPRRIFRCGHCGELAVPRGEHPAVKRAARRDYGGRQ